MSVAMHVVMLGCQVPTSGLTCLSQPEALHLNLPEMEIKHWHDHLLFEQAKHMYFAADPGTCKYTREAVLRCETECDVVQHSCIDWE